MKMPDGPRTDKKTLGKKDKVSRDSSQAEKFAQAAREHGASEDEETFKDVLRKLGSAPPVEIDRPVKRRGQSKSED